MIKNKHTLTRVTDRTGLTFDTKHHFITSTPAAMDIADELLERLGYKIVYRDLQGLGEKPYLWPKHG